MSDIDPQQELFTAVKVALESKGYAVYDGFLPPDGTPYPFIYLGEFRQSDTDTKNAVIGSVFPTIHIWSNTPKNRGTVSKMQADIKAVLRTIGHTANFAWAARNVTQRIFEDKTTKTPLMHGVVEAEMQFS